MIKLMVDLETLGTKPNSVILSIGAVVFDNNTILDEFYCNVDLSSSLKHGYEIDSSTIYWWLGQDSTAGSILSKDLQNIEQALSLFSSFVSRHPVMEVWANSPSFDLVMLRNALSKHNLVETHPFWKERDFRTFINTVDVVRVSPETPHNALEDARAQAQTIINYTRGI